MTDSVGTTKMSASAKRPASAPETISSRHTCTSPSAPKAIASRARSRVLHMHHGGEPLGVRGRDDRGDGFPVE